MDKTVKSGHVHTWKNDPMFEDGTITMLTNDKHQLGEEIRQFCSECGKIQYVYDGDRG